jgi:hypothetical protein
MSENATTVQELARPERLTPGQERLLGLIRSKASVPMEETSDGIDDVRSLIEAGHIELLVKQHVWGVEFALVLRTHSEGGRADGER